MPNDNAIKFGMLKCRDLVELYYGARMVASVVESAFSFTAPQTMQILSPDPRRIRYEIIIGNNNAAPAQLTVGTPSADDGGNDQFYSLPDNETIIIERDFLTDLDCICLALQASCNSGACIVSVRETFLTPIPVDEMP
jgi:hypothetical protein